MSLFQTDSGISTGRLNPSGPTPPPPKIDWSERLASQREKEEAARQKEEGGGLFGGFLGDVLRVGSTSLLPDIPFIPDFIEDTLFSPIGLASLALAPVTGGGSLVGRAGLTAVARGGVKPIFGTGAEALTALADDVLPENTPGGIRTALLFGAAAGGGVGAVSAVRGTRIGQFANLTNIADDAGITRIGNTFEELETWVKGMRDTVGDDTANTMELLLETHAAQKGNIQIARSMLQMLAAHPTRLDDIGREAISGVAPDTRWFRRTLNSVINPNNNKKGYVVAGNKAAEQAISVGETAMGERLRFFNARFKEATGLDQKDLLDADGRVLEFNPQGRVPGGVLTDEGVLREKGSLIAMWKGVGEKPAAANFPRHILMHPDQYHMNPNMQSIVRDLRDGLDNDFVALKQTRGAQIKTRTDFAGTQRWEQDIPYDAARERWARRGRSTSEFKRAMTLEEGLAQSPPLVPKRQSFLDVYRDDAIEELEQFAEWEGRRIAMAQAGYPISGWKQMSWEERKASRKLVKSIDKEIKGVGGAGGTQSRLRATLPKLGQLVGEAKQKVGTMRVTQRLTEADVAHTRKIRLGQLDTIESEVRGIRAGHDKIDELIVELNARVGRVSSTVEEGTEKITRAERMGKVKADILKKGEKTVYGRTAEGRFSGTTEEIKITHGERKELLSQVQDIQYRIRKLQPIVKTGSAIEKELNRTLKKAQKAEALLRRQAGRKRQTGVKAAQRIRGQKKKTREQARRERVEGAAFWSDTTTFSQAQLDAFADLQYDLAAQELDDIGITRIKESAADVDDAELAYKATKEFNRLVTAAMRNTGTFKKRVSGEWKSQEPKPVWIAPLPAHLVPDTAQGRAIKAAYDSHADAVHRKINARLQNERIQVDPDVEEAKRIIDRDYNNFRTELKITHSTIEQGGRAADAVRAMVLTADFSVFNIQFLAAAVGNPMRAAQDLTRALYFVLNPDGFQAYMSSQLEEVVDALASGLNLSDHLSSQIASSKLLDKGAEVGLLGKIPAFGPGLRMMNDALYGRGVTFLKYQAYRANVESMIAAQNQTGFRQAVSKATGRAVDKDLPESEIRRIAAEHVNNLLGGQNMKALGIGENQKNIEKMLILTPDYLRSTLGLTRSALTDFTTAKGALARRVLGLYAGMAIGATGVMSMMFSDKEPNLFNPSAPNWLQIRIDTPDGGTLNLNPFGRFVSLFRPIAKTADTLVEGASIEDAANTALTQTQRYFRGRLSTLPGITAEILENRDWAGNPVATDAGLNRYVQRGAHIARSMTPISFQNLKSEGLSLATAAEFLGVNAYSTTPTQNSAVNALTAAALEAGIPPEQVREAVRHGRNPLKETDENGQFILTSRERELGVLRATQLSGLDTDVVAQQGREDRLLSAKQQQAVDRSLRSSFFTSFDTVERLKSKGVQQLLAALQAGQIDHNSLRVGFGQLNRNRRAGYPLILDDQDGPYQDVIEELNDPTRTRTQNQNDILREQFLNEIFAEDLQTVGMNGLEFNFDESQRREQQWVQRFGERQIEIWKTQGQTNLTPEEQEWNAAKQYFLQDGGYWQQSDITWAEVGGLEFAAKPEILEHQDPEHPVLSRFNSLVRKNREALRRQDSTTNELVMKWLGLKPLEIGTRLSV